jgi:hypothetical protein
MLTGPKKWTEAAIDARQRAGFGEGRGSEYKAWHFATDISGDSRVHRVFSSKFQRTIHLLSDVERDAFEILEYSQDVVELEEQKPIEREDTLRIARELNVRHPYYPGTGVPTVMTIDLMVYRRLDGGKLSPQAWDCKYSLDDKDERQVDKLQITRRYCEERGIPHWLVFRGSLPAASLTNVKWIRGGTLKSGELEPYEGAFEEHLNAMALNLSLVGVNPKHASRTLSQFCTGYEISQGLPRGLGLRLAKTLLYERVLTCDIHGARVASMPMSEFRCSQRERTVA